MRQWQDLLEQVIAYNTLDDGSLLMHETRSGKVVRDFDYNLKWNLQEGFPIVTTKEVNLENILAELFMFLSGSCDRRIMQELRFGEFEDERFDIWKGDCLRAAKENPQRFNGYNLGNMYPVQWRMKRIPVSGVHKVKRKQDIDSDYQPVGNPTVAGVGINDVRAATKLHPKLYMLWRDMLVRCYGNQKRHQSWRDQGVTVSPRWHQFSNFLGDVYCLSGFQEWVSNPSEYCLDKDYFGAKVYSRNTCIFLERSLNCKLSSNTKVYEVNGEIFFGSQELADYYNIPRKGSIETTLTTRKLPFDIVDNEGEEFYRPKIYIDQLQNLITEIKENPTSRYLLVDSWNPNYEVDSVLGACHNMFQVYVDIDEHGYKHLDLKYNQRSVDSGLGLPYNITSYAMLLIFLAKLTGCTPRYLTASLGDTHIYGNSLSQISEILTREPYPLPAFKFPMFKSIEDLISKPLYKFGLVGYNNHGKVSIELKVGDKDERDKSTN